MSDALDQAAQYEEQDRARALAAHRARQATGDSATHCDDCGEPIPAARRQAVAGCRLCIDCAEYAERRR